MSPPRDPDIRDTLASNHDKGPAKRLPSALTRNIWLIAACVLAPLSLVRPEPALAQCTSSPCTVPAIPPPGYTSNIDLSGNAGDTLSLALDPGVIVNSPSGNAVNAAQN
jgi:hypothetical protein